MDISAITEVIGAAKGAVDTLSSAERLAEKLRKAIRGGDAAPAQNSAELAATVLELTGQLVDARTAQSAILHRLHDIEHAAKQEERFERELARYALDTLPGGAVVYTLQEKDKGTDPVHHLCPTCAERRQKMILQPAGRLLHCHACGADYEAEPPPGPTSSGPLRGSIY